MRKLRVAKREVFKVADAEALARVLYVFERIALRNGRLYEDIYVHPVLARDPETYDLKPEIDHYRISVSRKLYEDVVARVTQVDVISLIINGEYPDVKVF